MLVEHDPLGRQTVEARRVDPAVTVTPHVAQVQAAENQDDHFHSARLYRVCRQAAMRYNSGMARITLGPISFDKVVEAVEAVRQRLLRATAALEKAGIPYAVVGGNAVAVWVARVDPAAVRNTQDVDIMIRRADLEAAKSALEGVGFFYRHVKGID